MERSEIREELYNLHRRSRIALRSMRATEIKRADTGANKTGGAAAPPDRSRRRKNSVSRSRADQARAATPSHHVAIGIVDRDARPVAPGGGRFGVGRVVRIGGRRAVVARTRNGAADERATHHACPDGRGPAPAAVPPP